MQVLNRATNHQYCKTLSVAYLHSKGQSLIEHVIEGLNVMLDQFLQALKPTYHGGHLQTAYH